MWARIWQSKLMVFIIVVIVIIAVCWLVGLQFHASAGREGLDLVGIAHTKLACGRASRAMAGCNCSRPSARCGGKKSNCG
jgi:hypothetical protein